MSPVFLAEFTVFYKKCSPRLVAFLVFQGATLPDAAEFAQEALTLCFQQWTGITAPYSWSRTVAFRMYVRKRRAAETPMDDIEGRGRALLPSNLDLEAFENDHTILRLVSVLPDRQRQVMAWTYDGASTSDIAEELQISPSAVRSNLYKARATLRDLLRESLAGRQ